MNILAHAGHDHSGIVSGMLHPLGGIDHLLAMLAVGIIASKAGKQWVWIVPLTFVCSMIAGAFLGRTGWFVSEWIMESLIACSVIAFGLYIALNIESILPIYWVIGVIGLFGVFHGAAHGAEMPAEHSILGYFTGFTLSTIQLHLAGIVIGIGLTHWHANVVLRAMGGIIFLLGSLILIGIL